MAFNINFKAGGGSPWSFPTLPTPLNNDGLALRDGEKLPHKGTLVDNIRLSGDFNGQYVGFLGETTIWTVNDTDINASVEGFLGATASCWYDSINDRLYVFAIDTGTTPDTIYTAFITLETGAVTNIGNAQVTTDPTFFTTPGGMVVSRASIDSGNFTLLFRGSTIVINESTGAKVSNVVANNTTEGNVIGTYATLDGTIQLAFMQGTTAGAGSIRLTRNKTTISVPMTDSLIGSVSADSTFAIPWGDKVKMYANNASKDMLKTFLRTDFDEWLAEVADFGGLA